jgi:hypothetical protein
MFGPNGLRASELAAQLAELIDLHGDCHVMVSAGDYSPDDCTGVYYNTKSDGYYHADTFIVH